MFAVDPRQHTYWASHVAGDQVPASRSPAPGGLQIDRVTWGQPPSELRSNVCFMTSAPNSVALGSTTVRHTPLTLMESPGRAVAATAGLCTRSVRAVSTEVGHRRHRRRRARFR